MIVSKLGDSLIVRLPDEVVQAQGLKEGDVVDVSAAGARSPVLQDPAEREAAILRMRRFRGMLPADFKFNRDEANER